MYINMIDNGEPGVRDSISFVLVDGDGDPTILSNIMYSSNWISPKTEMMNLKNGNLVVHSGFNVGSTSSPTARVNTSVTPQQVDVTPAPTVRFELKASPNPTTSHFNVKLESSNITQPISLNVVDLSGKVIEMRKNLVAGQTLQLGANYRPGMYFVELIQGDMRRIVKLVKQPD